ncbi:MAG: 4-alpha-glucanotransferase [Cyclobacteriaceae bacterium]|nr:4-alpha-glucanotransferase [Cyclobacteriaceae bacterium]
MKIKFNINYHTVWGQNLYICGTSDLLGSINPSNALLMKSSGQGNWQLEIDLPKSSSLHYKYLLKDERGEEQLWEWGDMRRLSIPNTAATVVVEDAWRPEHDVENVLFTQAFTENLFKRSKAAVPKETTRANTRLRLIAPRIGKNQSFCVTGSAPSLGNWDPARAVIMDESAYPVWRADIQIEDSCEYKYAIFDHDKQGIIAWESGENRYLSRSGDNKVGFVIKTDNKFRYPLGLWKGAGVAVPVFSIKTTTSCGIGEFMDIKKLIDWAVQTRLKLVQILPINDTVATQSWTDSYPYAAISVFALHPIYLHLPKMGTLKDKKTMQEVLAKGAELNALPQIDYEAVMKLKSPFYKKLYDQQKAQFLKDEGFKLFFEENKSWLVPYAAFSRLRDQFGTPDFTQWAQYSTYHKDIIEDLVDPKQPDYDHYAVHYFIQYHLHLQMKEVADYAREKGVVLKGDIPIGIYRNSADAWVEPGLYHMDKQAGAPPDGYAISGQNWGFPTYNWEEMAKDGYSWWRRRLSKMAAYFDAYRIDHILGFFRIWEIPWHSVEGLMGKFNPAIPMFVDELKEKGLHFDHDRFCKPYIRGYMIDELFGADAAWVKEHFLYQGEADFYHMKEAFDTQRKVEAHFASLLPVNDDKERLLKIKQGLFTLIGNVLMLEDEHNEGRGYHPKIALHSTYSFKELDPAAQYVLDKIYIHYFYQRQEDFWREKAMIKLPAIINATNMLVCGEDLGMVPDCVPGVMDELGLLNLEIQRMPKKTNTEFSHPVESKYLSVVSPSCHDMSTIRGWWEENAESTRRFYSTILGQFGEVPVACEPWVSREVIVQHLQAPAMWAIFPIQDLVAIDASLRHPDAQAEQINVPSNPKHYWRFRFHLSIEDLLAAHDFNARLGDLVTRSGRGDEHAP